MQSELPQGSTSIGPGTVVDKYRITGPLGKGAMGVVFLAVHEALGREVAIKFLRREFTVSAELVMRFQREAELVSRIGHPNIVAVYDAGAYGDGSLYYVMERLQGEALSERMARTPLHDSELGDLFGALLSAVKAAHAIGVVHRDLKPGNIVLVPKAGLGGFVVKLLDFGVAKIHVSGEQSGEHSKDSGALGTMTGDIMGTPAYMAPEQVQNSADVDGRADIYALGIILYEVLTGRRPFDGVTMDLLLAHLFTPPKPPSVVAAERGVVRPMLDWQRLDEIVLKMLAKDRADRYQDCQLVMDDLARVWPTSANSGSFAAPSAVTPDAELAAPPATRRRFIGAAVGLALAVVAAGGVGIYRLRRPRLHVRTLEQGRQVAAEIIAAAQTGTPAQRRDLLEAIAGARSRPLLAIVVQGLADEHSGVAQAALLAAVTVGRPGDVELLAALREQSTRVIGATAVEVAVARAQLGDEAARPLLIAAASSSTIDATTRLRATLALTEAKQAPASLLRVALAAANHGQALRPALRRAALTTLVRLQDAQTVAQINAALMGQAAAERLDAAAVMTAAGHKPCANLILEAAQTAKGSERAALCLVLAEADDDRCLALLPLRDPQPELRWQATIALALLGRTRADQPQVTSSLLPLLTDSDLRVATAAAVAILNLGTDAQSQKPGAHALSRSEPSPSSGARG